MRVCVVCTGGTGMHCAVCTSKFGEENVCLCVCVWLYLNAGQQRRQRQRQQTDRPTHTVRAKWLVCVL